MSKGLTVSKQDSYSSLKHLCGFRRKYPALCLPKRETQCFLQLFLHIPPPKCSIATLPHQLSLIEQRECDLLPPLSTPSDSSLSAKATTFRRSMPCRLSQTPDHPKTLRQKPHQQCHRPRRTYEEPEDPALLLHECLTQKYMRTHFSSTSHPTSSIFAIIIIS